MYKTDGILWIGLESMAKLDFVMHVYARWQCIIVLCTREGLSPGEIRITRVMTAQADEEQASLCKMKPASEI